MKTQQLEGPLLNYWTAQAAGMNPQFITHENGYQACRLTATSPLVGCYIFEPSTNWTHAGPIIKEHKLTITDGDLVAAMRDFVAAKFGANVSDNLPN